MEWTIGNVLIAAATACIIIYYLTKAAVTQGIKEARIEDGRSTNGKRVSGTLLLCLEKKCHISLMKNFRFGTKWMKEIEATVISLDENWVGLLYEGEDLQAATTIVRVEFVDAVQILE